MSGWEAFWLGLVQGLSEFLPVSSSGHLVIFRELLGVQLEAGLVFEIAVHAATALAIAIFYRRRIGALLVGAWRRELGAWRYGAKLGLATLPAVAVGLGARDAVEATFADPRVTGVCLLVTGAILWTTRRTLPSAQAEEPGWGEALAIGVAQALAILPGISRSGTTVAAALALGVRSERAAEFSFLMGVIAIAGAVVLMLDDLERLDGGALVAMGAGSLAALVSGIAAIWLFVRLLRARAFHGFAYYTWAAGAAFLVWLAIGR